MNRLFRLSDLIVTHHGIRDRLKVKMIAAEVSSGKLLIDEPLIRIGQFPDNRLYILDGHHRCLGKHLAGKIYMYGPEFKLEQWTYEQFGSVNFETGWLTPYDPRTEVRKPDFLGYRNDIIEMRRELGEVATRNWIEWSKDLYAERRMYNSIEELRMAVSL